MPTHTRAINPLKEFTSEVVPSPKQNKPTPPLELFLKEHAKGLVNIGKANLVVDEIVEDIMATIISREANLGVISIVDNEGLEVNKDQVEVQEKEATTILGNLDIDFLCKETKVGSKEDNEANDDKALTQEEKRYGGSKHPKGALHLGHLTTR